MMNFQWLSLFMAAIICFSGRTNAFGSRVVRQVASNQCPLPANSQPCLFVFCDNGGTCNEDRRITDCYRCACAVGFTGKTCESRITAAQCNPSCENGGTCIGNVCSCPAGYIGSRCEIRDFCSPINPCQNGGRCAFNSNTFICDCTNTGYTGLTCNTAVITDLCASRPCRNGGQCSASNGVVTCSCVNGFSGTFCDIAPIPCVVTPCENGGKCQLITAGTYGCVCPSQYTGVRCESSVLATHPCTTMASTVCQNGATCTVNGADYLCKCAVGWRGKNCELGDEVTTCDTNPCGLHGSCLQAILSSGPVIFCSCENRWTGKFCDVNMDATCAPGICLSGGTCRVNGNAVVCDCPPAYTGQRCEALITTLVTTTTVSPGVNRCSPNPCLNGGSCFNGVNSFICMCTPQWIGSTCNIVNNTRPSTTSTTTSTSTSTTTRTTTTTRSSSFITCATRPCLNAGFCFDDGNSFFCFCQPQWTGPTCSISTTNPTVPTVTPCSPNPCANGGSCFKDGSEFLCICTSQFTGPTCNVLQPTPVPTSTNSGPMKCVNQPCRNGGSCFSNGNSYYCYCAANYSGMNCELVKAASSSTCPLDCGSGSCVSTGNAQAPFACMCNGVMKLTICS